MASWIRSLSSVAPAVSTKSFMCLSGIFSRSVEGELSQGSTIDVSAVDLFGKGGSVVIRGGRFVMSDSTIKANGLVGSIDTVVGGPIEVRADDIALNNSTLSSDAIVAGGKGGSITLVSKGNLDIQNSSVRTGGSGGIGTGGTISEFEQHLHHRRQRFWFCWHHTDQRGSPIHESTKHHFGRIVLPRRHHSGESQQGCVDGYCTHHRGEAVGGSITVEAKNLTLKNSQILSTVNPTGQGGTINITSPRFHQDASSVIVVSSQLGTNGTVTINGVILP